MSTHREQIPYLGVGVGLRWEIGEDILRYENDIDVLEIISENFFLQETEEYLKKFSSRFPLIPHGIKLSIGSALSLSETFLSEAKRLVKELRAPYYSDHFSLSHLGAGEDLDTDHLSPLWFTKDMVEHVSGRVEYVQEYLGVPLVLENIAAHFTIPEADYEEPEFISKVCERTGCGLLLDITNLHINAFNAGIDPFALLERYPLESVVQVHIAGGFIGQGRFYDSHSEEVTGPNERVWKLLKRLRRRVKPKAVILERDQNFKPDFQKMIMEDLQRAREIIEA